MSAHARARLQRLPTKNLYIGEMLDINYMNRKYKFHNKAGLYFVSFATVYWLDLFTRQVHFYILANSVNYCRSQKGM